MVSITAIQRFAFVITGATYKFRIAAVYSNNDNKHGPNSDRFEMKADPQPVAKPPSTAPTIVEVTAIDFQNIHGLNVRWQVGESFNENQRKLQWIS